MSLIWTSADTPLLDRGAGELEALSLATTAATAAIALDLERRVGLSCFGGAITHF